MISTLLLVLATGFIVGSVGICPDNKQNPVIFIPGLFGSVLDMYLDIPTSVPLPNSKCLRKTSDWKQVWLSGAELLEPEVECFLAYLEFQFNNLTGESNPKPGVSFRAPDFGSVYAIDRLDPNDIITELSNYGHKAIETLRLAGFDEGRTIFAAPHDWRFLPQTKWIQDTKELVENAFNLSGGNKVVIIGHSLGCPYSYVFMMSQTLAWRQKYIKHWIPIAGTWTGVPIAPYSMLAKAMFGLPWYFGKMGNLMRHIPSMFFLSPDETFGDQTIVTTPTHKYNWKNLGDVLARDKIVWGTKALEKAREIMPKFKNEHPGINTTFIWSTGFKTISGMHYDLDSEVGITAPWPDFGDGDTQVPAKSLSFMYDLWDKDKSLKPLNNKIVYTSGELATNHISLFWYKGFLDELLKVSCSTN